MRKAILVFGVASMLLVFSCRKTMETSNKPVFMQTITSDLRTSATTVPLSLASELAQKFLQSKNPNRTVSIKSAETVIKNGVPYIHIINANDNAGFAMIAADSLYKPILAYDSTGNFDKNKLNAGLVLWFNKHGRNLDDIRNHKNPSIDSITSNNKKIWLAMGQKFKMGNSQMAANKNIKVNGNATKPNFYYYPEQIIGSGTDIWYNTVGPLCATTWGQVYPYNQYCPSGSYSGGHMPAGCVPVAMAQVMYYWQYPSAYGWGSMVTQINSNPATSPSNNPSGFTESARLIHDIGTTTGPVFINALTNFATSEFVYYQDDGSSAEDAYCPYVFGNFGYGSASRTETISDQIFSGAKNGVDYAWLLKDEASSHRPSVLTGHTGMNTILGLIYWPYLEGHTWVCDGVNEIIAQSYNIIEYYDHYGNPSYTEVQYIENPRSVLGYVHINWGWSGTNNGWYDYFTNYATSSGGDFQYFQTVIYDIHP